MLTCRAHKDFVRCVKFDHERILSTGDDGRAFVRTFEPTRSRARGSPDDVRACTAGAASTTSYDRIRETAAESQRWLERPDTAEERSSHEPS